MTLHPNEHNNDGEKLCEGCGEPLGDAGRWCDNCQSVYNAGIEDTKKSLGCFHCEHPESFTGR